jgi:putative MFS transporter
VVTGTGLEVSADRSVPRSAPGSVSERMDRLPLTWLHIALVALGTLGFAFDLLELSLGNVLSAVFSAPPYSVDAVQLSWLLAAMYIGAIPGALAAGWLADRFGRRVVMFGVLLVLGVTSVGAAASPDINSLIVARMLSGLALGAYPPLLFSFLTDLMPPRRRGMLIVMSAGIASLGPVAMIFLVRALTPTEPLGIEAWRWAFIVGAVGALVIAIAFRFLPESPRWLAARGRHREAELAVARFERSPIAIANPASAVPTQIAPVPAVKDAPTTAAATEKPNLRHFALIAGIYFASPWGTVAFPVLMGAVLIEKGFALSDSLLYVGVSMFGPALGTVMGSLFIDRFERRLILAVFGIGMIASAVVFAASLSPFGLMAAGIAFQLLAILQVSTMTTYAAEVFPTAWRARTSTAAWSINRVASAIAVLLLLPLLKVYGIGPMFAVIVTALAIGIALVFIAPKGRAGRAVD